MKRSTRSRYQDLEGRCKPCGRVQAVAELENYERYPSCDVCGSPLSCARPSFCHAAQPSRNLLVYDPADGRLNQYLVRIGLASLQAAPALEIHQKLTEYATECAWDNEAGKYRQLACERVIQIMLAAYLRALGWQVRVEVLKRRASNRFDIVLYQTQVAVRIIELKRRRTAGWAATDTEFVAWHTSSKTEEQLRRYRSYGVPVDLIQGVGQVLNYQQWFNQHVVLR